MSGRASGNRFGWLSEEEDQRAEEARQEEPPAPLPRSPAPEPTDLRSGLPHGLPGVGGRRKRNRPKNPEALRNDPARMMAGARIRKDVRRRVDQALADPPYQATRRPTSACWWRVCSYVGSRKSGIRSRAAEERSGLVIAFLSVTGNLPELGGRDTPKSFNEPANPLVLEPQDDHGRTGYHA